MALKKEIELSNGVITNYHRIVSINSIINKHTIIEVAMYTLERIRLEEKEEASEDNPINLSIDTTIVKTDYKDNLGIEEAYEYLKTLKQFEGAEDC